MRLHLAGGTSNHIHLIVSSYSSVARADFKCHLKTNLSKELGDLYGWTEHLFGRRSYDIQILDEQALQDRLRYVLAHGIKEGLVSRKEGWPGIPWVAAVTKGQPEWVPTAFTACCGQNGCNQPPSRPGMGARMGANRLHGWPEWVPGQKEWVPTAFTAGLHGWLAEWVPTAFTAGNNRLLGARMGAHRLHGWPEWVPTAFTAGQNGCPARMGANCGMAYLDHRLSTDRT